MPRGPWSTSSQALLPRLSSAAAPAVAAAVVALTAHRVLPRPGAPPARSPLLAGPSDGCAQVPLPCPPARSGRGYRTEFTSSHGARYSGTGCVHLSRLHSGPAVLWGQGEVGRAGQGSVVQSGIILEAWAGVWVPHFLQGPRPPPTPGHSVSTICKPTQGWTPPLPSPLIYFPSSAFCHHPRVTGLILCPVPPFLNLRPAGANHRLPLWLSGC